MKVYLAAPLFTCAERDFNERLALAIENCGSIKMILPQRCAAELPNGPDFPQRMFHCALEDIDECDMVIAVLDGADADSGTCVEIGYAKGIGKRVIGVRTDLRVSEDRGLNLMVANICSELVFVPAATTSPEELAASIAECIHTKRGVNEWS